MWLRRTAAGLTQPQAADRLGITTTMYANYEIGRRTPNAVVRACIDAAIRGTA